MFVIVYVSLGMIYGVDFVFSRFSIPGINIIGFFSCGGYWMGWSYVITLVNGEGWVVRVGSIARV